MSNIKSGTQGDRFWNVAMDEESENFVFSCAWYEERDDVEIRCECRVDVDSMLVAEALGTSFLSPIEGIPPHVQFKTLVASL